ncbi:PepSY domain-containing protein [Pseudalkalibacillus sp. SCS-8]|uniref:PepSY domain-containing protein n=1 Tax=Pseudalkalibacillus nanhaiensis TaxID=3115291 RepID=UPI0032DB07B8
MKRFSKKTLFISGLAILLLGGGIFFGTQGLDAFANSNQSELIKQADLTIEEAEKAALEEVPGKVTGKTEIEKEDGKLVYEVTIKSESDQSLKEVELDANTGEILEVEAEDDEDDDDDDENESEDDDDEEKEKQ